MFLSWSYHLFPILDKGKHHEPGVVEEILSLEQQYDEQYEHPLGSQCRIIANRDEIDEHEKESHGSDATREPVAESLQVLFVVCPDMETESGVIR